MERMKIEDNDGINEIYLKVTIQDLEEENKNLKDKIDLLEEEIIILKEKKGNLKEELSKYKKYYDRDKEELMESCYALAKENDKLKSDLSECECSMHFENDEVGYRKRECKKLKEEIRFLEQCLDNKEKVNKSLREELEKIKSTYVYDAKQVRDIC